MKKHKILLSTICPEMYDIQLALYYLKAYFIKNCSHDLSLVNIDIKVFIPQR